jgi:hypothetical protein
MAICCGKRGTGVLEESDEIPDEYKCPITLALMKDPVVLSDGHSYERSSLEDWLHKKNKNTSPKTNQILENKIFFTNQNLARLIARFREKTGEGSEDTDSFGTRYTSVDDHTKCNCPSFGTDYQLSI